jgi:hypothetical protein
MNQDEAIRRRLAEIMSSAGLGYNQISLEVLYLLPAEFIQRYTWLWEKALGPAGSGDATGQQLARDAGLERARTRTEYRGTRITGASSTGKKWKRMGLAVRDEKALKLKDRIDRRLRSIARDIAAFEDTGGKGEGKGTETAQCTACGIVADSSWNFCPYDGRRMIVRDSGKANEK